ncbi:hypothetical protein I552_2965 [Mycobacterium xenopi 3993]|nr:hypothetical protein I552_2965 [Mycobacterium xenopi 3993]
MLSSAARMPFPGAIRSAAISLYVVIVWCVLRTSGVQHEN